MIPRCSSTIPIYSQESGPKYEVTSRYLAEQRSYCFDLFYFVIWGSLSQPLSHSSVPFSAQTRGCLSERLYVQFDWLLSHEDYPSVDMAFGRFLLPTQCDLLGEERQSFLPVGSRLGDAGGRSCWQPYGRTALSLSAWGMCWPPCCTAVTAPWPTMDTKQQTPPTEACFLFACHHVACPP